MTSSYMSIPDRLEYIRQHTEPLHAVTSLNFFTVTKDMTVWKKGAGPLGLQILSPIIELCIPTGTKIFVGKITDLGCFRNPTGQPARNRNRYQLKCRAKEARVVAIRDRFGALMP